MALVARETRESPASHAAGDTACGIPGARETILRLPRYPAKAKALRLSPREPCGVGLLAQRHGPGPLPDVRRRDVQYPVVWRLIQGEPRGWNYALGPVRIFTLRQDYQPVFDCHR